MTKDAVFKEVPVAKIKVLDRARFVKPEAVEVLRQSYEAHGGFTTAIHVRTVRGGFELIDGAHRLTLARELGLDLILARVWKCTRDEAKFFETDANVALAHLSPVGLARSLAERHAAYTKLHPDTAAGVAGGKARQNQQRTEMSFADFVGAVMGVTPRQVRRIVNAGRSLGAQDAQMLETAPKRVTMEDLYEIAKIGSEDERSYVVSALTEGAAKKASAARKAFKAETEGAPAPVSPTDKAFLRLMDAWDRAPKAARRQFLENRGDDVAALLEEIGVFE